LERIAIYGKGGIGKSVVATNLSTCYAQRDLKVLHVGCDPKHDSSVRLMPAGAPVRTVLDMLGDRPRGIRGEDVINIGRLGIACCESGGPEPGVGCAGRGVARTLEFLQDQDVFRAGGYDVVMFDVLGDVVCGGFAAPLRAGFAQKVLIVTSEEPMSIYAANNICKAVRTYQENGVVLAGLVANLRNNDADREALDVFASVINTRVLACIPRDETIPQAEEAMTSLVEFAPESPAAGIFRDLADTILSTSPDDLPPPNPLTDDELLRYISKQRSPQ
jgi:nitrogenase iron protein NifH